MKERKQIKDFKIALKDLERHVRNPKFLIDGREFPNFSLRPREAWANWLLCVVLQKLHGEHITFSEDRDCDGIIVDKILGIQIKTEHVSALENPFNIMPKGEARIIDAINKKIAKGADYAKNKILVVFFDGAGEYYRNKIRESIYKKHNFESIFCIGLITSSDSGYSYVVTEFRDIYDEQSVSFRVEINKDFTNWEVTHMTE